MTESAANDPDQTSGTPDLPEEGSEADPGAPGPAEQDERDVVQGEDEIVPVQFGQLEEPSATKANGDIAASTMCPSRSSSNWGALKNPCVILWL